MKPAKAWVVSIVANYRVGVLAVLPPYWGIDRVGSHLEFLHAITCLTLEEQAATFRRKNPLVPNRANRDSEKLVTVWAGSGAMILAQRSVVREIIDDDSGKQTIRFQPESFKTWKVDPKTFQPYVVEEVKPKEITSEMVDLRLNTLLPKRRQV